jgi:hypothetical protein
MRTDGSNLPIRDGQWLGPGSWRDSVGNIVPGPLTVLQESLGKREKKKEKNGGLRNVPHGTEKLGEGMGNGRVREGDKYEGIPT